MSRGQVTLLDRFGMAEEGDDQGGLTAEMFSLFFREVFAPEAGLFEQASCLHPPRGDWQAAYPPHPACRRATAMPLPSSPALTRLPRSCASAVASSSKPSSTTIRLAPA